MTMALTPRHRYSDQEPSKGPSLARRYRWTIAYTAVMVTLVAVLLLVYGF